MNGPDCKGVPLLSYTPETNLELEGRSFKEESIP